MARETVREKEQRGCSRIFRGLEVYLEDVRGSLKVANNPHMFSFQNKNIIANVARNQERRPGFRSLTRITRRKCVREVCKNANKNLWVRNKLNNGITRCFNPDV